MRVTCDMDNHNYLKLIYYLIKGTILFRRLPYLIRKTKRGFHYGWNGLKISEAESYYYRLILGDDINRIKLDIEYKKKPKQILFTHKKVYLHEYDNFGNYMGKRRIA